MALDNTTLLDLFSREGFCELPGVLDAASARDLFERARALHPFDSSMFMSEQEWESGPKSHKLTNPGPGNNALEKLADPIAFVRDNKQFDSLMTELLGKNFKWLHGKLVCRLPNSALPHWLAKKIAGKPANTLGAFMPPEYRDFTYLLDTDLHQDIQDWNRMPPATRDHRFITLYVYLNDVTPDEAPITMVPGSHRFGATAHQHDVTYDARGWTYRDDAGREMTCSLKPLIGQAGYMGFWHPSMLHGSHLPPKDGHLRISLRYLLARSDDPAPCRIDEVNAAIDGPLYLERDYNPGMNADKDGMWTLKPSDYMKQDAGA